MNRSNFPVTKKATEIVAGERARKLQPIAGVALEIGQLEEIGGETIFSGLSIPSEALVFRGVFEEGLSAVAKLQGVAVEGKDRRSGELPVLPIDIHFEST